MKQHVAGILFLALGSVGSVQAAAQDPSRRTYTDTVYGYAFDYPARYQVQQQFHSVFLTDGHVHTEVYVEDWTRAMSRAGSHWDLASLAAERAEASCMADGPDCSTSCKAHSVQEIPNSHGVRVLSIPRTRFDTCKPSPARTLDPLYVADLSNGAAYHLLIFGARLDEPGVPSDTLRAIVATLRRVFQKPDTPAAKILGTWRGTSICADPQVDRACRDEEVVYDIDSAAGPSGPVRMRADKVVGGVRQAMGELRLRYDSTTDTWSAEVVTRFRSRWSFAPRGDVMAGALAELPSQRLVRRVTVRRASAQLTRD